MSTCCGKNGPKQSKKDGMKRGWMMIDGTKLNRKGVGLLLRKVRRAVG